MARLDPTGVSRILSYIKTWVTTALGGKANSSHNHTKSQITDFPTIPSSTSQLTNDSGYITSSGSCNYANSAGSAGSATTAETVSTSVAADSSKALVYASMANTDQCRIMCGGADNNGYLEIATSDDGNEPIYVRQYNNGTFGSVVRTLTLLDGSGNTQFPGTVSAPTFSGNLTGNCSGSCNYANSAGGVAWDNVSGKPSAFTPYFANNTWYAVGDDAAIGDHNVGGGLGVKALNSTTTRIDFCYKDDASNYKSITYDGTTLYMNGNCNYANSAGNSDTLDGYHEYSFLRNRGSTSTSGEGTLWAQIGIKEYYNALPDGLNDVYNYGEVVSLAGTSCRFDIYCSHHSSNGGGLYYRSGWNDDKKAWRCFIDSANIGSQSVNYANSAGSANDPNAVHKSGDETIDGVKTYSSDIYSVSSQHLRFRHLDGSNNGGMDGCLFLNYDNNAKNVYFNGASYYINGGYYNGKAENAQYTYWLRTSSHADHLLHTEWDGSYFWTYVTAGDGGYRPVRVERSNSSGYADNCGYSRLLATYADDGHYLCPDRYDGWNTRLYMTYGDKGVKADSVHVHHADYASRSAGDGSFFISGYQIYVG